MVWCATKFRRAQPNMHKGNDNKPGVGSQPNRETSNAKTHKKYPPCTLIATKLVQTKDKEVHVSDEW